MASRWVVQAVDLARSHLVSGWPDQLSYHSLHHTEDEVVAGVQVLAQGEGIADRDRDLLVVAAWFHDLGYLHTVVGHERIGADRAAEHLTGLGAPQEAIDTVVGLILATQVPQRPEGHLQQIICDADLCGLGGTDFWSRSMDLKAEREALDGVTIAMEEWIEEQRAFVGAHSFWTATARRLWGPQERRNLESLDRDASTDRPLDEGP